MELFPVGTFPFANLNRFNNLIRIFNTVHPSHFETQGQNTKLLVEYGNLLTILWNKLENENINI